MSQLSLRIRFHKDLRKRQSNAIQEDFVFKLSRIKMQLWGTGSPALLNPFFLISPHGCLTYYFTDVFIPTEPRLDVSILYLIHELVFIPYPIRANSAVTAVSDVTDMQLATQTKKSRPRLSLGCSCWRKKKSGYIKGTRSAWLVEDDETEAAGCVYVYIQRW